MFVSGGVVSKFYLRLSLPCFVFKFVFKFEKAESDLLSEHEHPQK